jgi:hypothetical protein
MERTVKKLIFRIKERQITCKMALEIIQKLYGEEGVKMLKSAIKKDLEISTTLVLVA